MKELKRVMAIHDLSCLGKCSLTVALPILSAANVECAVLPTAVLSTHTGGFKNVICRDLTADMQPIAHHWQREGICFDAIYTGYLASFEQIKIVDEIIDLFRGMHTPIMIDPVMGDNGQLYSLYTPEMAQGMAALCKKADILVPNLTEAAILLGQKYYDEPLNKTLIEKILQSLANMGPRQIVLTGVSFIENEVGAACFDANSGNIDYVMAERIPGSYHGTGDIFASVLLAGLLKGRNLCQAAQLAVDFTCESIRRTDVAGTPPRYGVHFEAGLATLAERL